MMHTFIIFLTKTSLDESKTPHRLFLCRRPAIRYLGVEHATENKDVPTLDPKTKKSRARGRA